MKNTKKPRDAEVDILPPENAADTEGSAAQGRLRMPPVIEHNPFLQRLKKLWATSADKAVGMTGNLGTNIGEGASRAGHHIAGWPHHIWDFTWTLTYRLLVLLLICASLALVGYGIWHNRGEIDTTVPRLPMAELSALLDRGRVAAAALFDRLATARTQPVEQARLRPVPQQTPEPASDIPAPSPPVSEAAPDLTATEQAAVQIPENAQPLVPPAANLLRPPAFNTPSPPDTTPLALPALLLRVESGAPFMLELARARQSGGLTDDEYDRLYAYAGFGVVPAAHLQHKYAALRDSLLAAAQNSPTPPGWLAWLARNSSGLVQLRARRDQADSLGLARLDFLVAQQDFANALAELDNLAMRADIAAAKPDLRRWRADTQAHLYVAPLLADLRRRFLDADPIGAAFVNGKERQTR
jgi:hypothetical protein